VQDEQSRWFKLLDDEAALGFRRTIGNEVTHLKILKIFHDVISAFPVCWKQQLVDPARGVRTAAVPTHLDQPRPHTLRRSFNGDSVRDHELGLGHHVVTRHRRAPFEGGGAIHLPEPMQAGVSDQPREQRPTSSLPADAGVSHGTSTLASGLEGSQRQRSRRPGTEDLAKLCIMSRSEEPTSAAPTPREGNVEASWAAAPLPSGLTQLDRAECLDLLAAKSVGRIAYTADVGARILPMNYIFADDCIIFRTVPDGEIYRHALNSNCAFEIDEIDEFFESGWSVVVVGQLELATEEDFAGMRYGKAPEPWAGGNRIMFVRLPCEQVSGRRVIAGR
jgi:uncharacterized protein